MIELELVAQEICSRLGLRFEGKIGAGAFKETFLVVAGAGEQYALKVHSPMSLSERAEREIAAMIKCNHPNIAKLRNVDDLAIGPDRYLYCLEEYLAGGTIAAHLRAKGLLSRREALALGGSLIDAIAHVASHRLVHRDIKPENVMLREDGVTPVLVDFGLVRSLDESSLTQSWAVRGPGTPLFAPAEQLLNEKAGIDWRADQFALGVLLSFATFGFHPYSERDTDHAEAVARVASRGSQSDRFMAATERDLLPALKTMTAAWPIHRHRTPALLAASWDAQRGAK